MLVNYLAQIDNPVLEPGVRSLGGWDYLNNVLPNVVLIALIAGTVFFFFMLLIGAVEWISSGGNREKVEEARHRITNALIGLFILFAIFAFIQLVNVFLGINIGGIGFGNPPGGPLPTRPPVGSPTPHFTTITRTATPPTCIEDMECLTADAPHGTSCCSGNSVTDISCPDTNTRCGTVVFPTNAPTEPPCSGCFEGTTCLPGTSNISCGNGGVACIDCTLSGDVCIGGDHCEYRPTNAPTEPPPTLAPPTKAVIECSCDPLWSNRGCGLGSCASDEMYQTRNCSPAGCDVDTNCTVDASCAPLPTFSVIANEATGQSCTALCGAQTCSHVGLIDGLSVVNDLALGPGCNSIGASCGTVMTNIGESCFFNGTFTNLNWTLCYCQQ